MSRIRKIQNRLSTLLIHVKDCVDSVIFTVSDTLRTEKTLPQVTRIKVFPSSIIVDKKGKVIKLDTGFFGPGRGVHYENFKKEF